MEKCDNKKADKINKGLLALIAVNVVNTSLFEYVDSEEREKKYFLMGMVLYYKSHYLCVLNEDGRWLLYDDHVYAVFNDWGELIEHLRKNVYMPISLYYKEERRKSGGLITKRNTACGAGSDLRENTIKTGIANEEREDFLLRKMVVVDELPIQTIKEEIDPKRAVAIEKDNQVLKKMNHLNENQVYSGDNHYEKDGKRYLNKDIMNTRDHQTTNTNTNSNKDCSKDVNPRSKEKLFGNTFSFYPMKKIEKADDEEIEKEVKKEKENEIDQSTKPKSLIQTTSNSNLNKEISTAAIEPLAKTFSLTADFNFLHNDSSQKENNSFSEANSTLSSSSTKKPKEPRVVLPSQFYSTVNKPIKNQKDIQKEKEMLTDNEWDCKKCLNINPKDNYCCLSCANINLELYIKLKNPIMAKITTEREDDTKRDMIANHTQTHLKEESTKISIKKPQSIPQVAIKSKGLLQKDSITIDSMPKPTQEEPITLPHQTKFLKKHRVSKVNNPIQEMIDDSKICMKTEDNQLQEMKPKEVPKKVEEKAIVKEKRCLSCDGTSFYEAKCIKCGAIYAEKSIVPGDQVKMKYDNSYYNGFKF